MRHLAIVSVYPSVHPSSIVPPAPRAAGEEGGVCGSQYPSCRVQRRQGDTPEKSPVHRRATHTHETTKREQTIRTPMNKSDLTTFEALRSESSAATNRRQREQQPPFCCAELKTGTTQKAFPARSSSCCFHAQCSRRIKQRCTVPTCSHLRSRGRIWSLKEMRL